MPHVKEHGASHHALYGRLVRVAMVTPSTLVHTTYQTSLQTIAKLHSWMLQDFLSHTKKNDEKLEKEFNVLTCP